MSKQSVENLKVADSARLIPFISNGVYQWTNVSVSRNGNVAYLYGSDGLVNYPSALVARRSIKRIRPDLEPTEI
jgi:hypothetical protein